MARQAGLKRGRHGVSNSSHTRTAMVASHVEAGLIEGCGLN